MSKRIQRVISEYFEPVYRRKLIFNMYMAKYYNLFMGAYRITKVTENQQEFILRRFWSMGKLAAFIVGGTAKTQTDLELEYIKKQKGIASVNDYPDGMIAFTDFAPCRFDIYDWPIAVNLVCSRGATFIPREIQNVNETCVIGYCQKNKLPVKTIVEFYVARITDIEMTINQQLKSHKVPWIIASSPENEAKMKKMFDEIEQDNDALFMEANEVDSIKTFQGNTAYIIDKLYAQKQAYENELLTYLGIDNLGQMQKKEHFVVDEVNSNNELINDFGDCFLDTMKSFFERIRKYLKVEIDIEAIARPVEETGEEEQEKDGDEDVE